MVVGSDVRNLLKAGLNVREIAGAAGVSRQRVYQILEEEGLPTPSEVEHGYRTRVEVMDGNGDIINTFYAEVGGFDENEVLKLVIDTS